MSITTIFYMADVASKATLISLSAILFLACFLLLASLPALIGEKINLSPKTVKAFLIAAICLTLISVFTPSRQTLYIYGGEQAARLIAESKDTQEIVGLIKKITVSKLREMAEEGEK